MQISFTAKVKRKTDAHFLIRKRKPGLWAESYLPVFLPNLTGYHGQHYIKSHFFVCRVTHIVSYFFFMEQQQNSDKKRIRNNV